MLGIDPRDPVWQWAAYQLDVAAYVAGVREMKQQQSAARRDPDDWDNLPRMSPSAIRSMMER